MTFTKHFTLLLFCLAVSAVTVAQPSEKRSSSLSRLLHKHVYQGEYERPAIKVEAPKDMRRAKNALGADFNESVWFPGEWGEGRAVVVTARYDYLVPGHEDDGRYSAEQLVKNWGNLYYQEDAYSPAKSLGTGPCKSRVDVETRDAQPFLYVMDGIQKAGAEAWVRIEEAGDEQIICTAMQNAGLQTDKMRFFVAPDNTFWYRDCGPICFYYGDEDKIGMLDFLYDDHRPCDDLLPSVLHWKFGISNYQSDLVWEGGNCLVDGIGGLVTSTATYKHNTDTIGRLHWDGSNPATIMFDKKEPFSPSDVKFTLANLLGQRQTTILPTVNYDGGTGHIDLYLDATDENSFYMAQMPETYEGWSDYDIWLGNTTILFNKKSFFGRKYYNNGSLPIPSKNDGSGWDSEEEYGRIARTYANHLICNDYILQPCFSEVGADGMPTAEWDRKNIEKMKSYYPGYTFYCIDMRTFDGSGGSIHCITKQIPADNPVRIIHKDIYGNVNPVIPNSTDQYIPFSAIITNKSGIKEAKLCYTTDGNQWFEVKLTANGNCWHADIPLSNFTGGQPISANGIPVSYYLSATSNNGKTVTKPINATKGNLYGFTITSAVEYDKNQFDYTTEPVQENMIKFYMANNLIREDTSTEPTTTGIVEIADENREMENARTGWYTISGMPLTQKPATKGIYIHNGVKVVIK